MVKNKKLLVLNVVLAVVVAVAAAGLYASIGAANERYSILTPQLPLKDVPDYPGPEAARRVRAGDYLPIVDRMLFSSDRNPTIEVTGPLQDSPESRPPLPRLAGIMELGDGPVALMSPDLDSPATPIEVGERVGAYTFLGTQGEKVLLQWGNHKIAAMPSELRGSPRDDGRGRRRAGSKSAAGSERARRPSPSIEKTAPSRTSAPRARSVQVKNPTRKQPDEVGGKYNIGPHTGSGRYRADHKDKSPAGTRYKGFIKRSQQTPFGTRYWWEKENQ